MALKDLLTLVNVVTVNKTISTPNGLGGATSTTSSSLIPLCAIWQNGSSNRFIADKYAKTSTHTLCYEYGSYTFDAVVTGSSVIETITYANETYKRVGYPDNVMNLNEIITQQLERIS